MNSELKVKICDIGRDGYEFEGVLSAEYIGLTKSDHLHFISPLKVNAFIERFEDSLLAKITAGGRYQSFCGRTLDKVERDWKTEFILDFEIERNAQFVDIADDVRQEIIIRIPVKVLSDAELAKDEKCNQVQPDILEEDVAQNESKTHRPFEGLKDIE